MIVVYFNYNSNLSITNFIVDPIDAEPLQFWREHQERFPIIAVLARDILSIPATGAGVERLFNTARDICYYCRGRMKSKTIEELMIFLCTLRFDLEEQQRKELEKFFSLDEIESAKEENDEKPGEPEIDVISDTDELDTESGNLIVVDDVKMDSERDKGEDILLETNT